MCNFYYSVGRFLFSFRIFCLQEGLEGGHPSLVPALLMVSSARAFLRLRASPRPVAIIFPHRRRRSATLPPFHSETVCTWFIQVEGILSSLKILRTLSLDRIHFLVMRVGCERVSGGTPIVNVELYGVHNFQFQFLVLLGKSS